MSEKNGKVSDPEDKNTGIEQPENQSESQENTTQEQPDDELAKLKGDVEEQKNKYLRLYADFENYKKRNAKERLEFLKVAGQEVIRDLLTVLDDFQRAEKMYAQDQNAENYVQGVKLIFEKFQRVLQNKGLKPIDSIGKDFNIEFHEAIAEVPAPEDQKGKIIDEAEKGYTLNDSIIRYAKVIVGK